MAKLGVQIVGDAAGLKAALGQSLAATEKWASETEGQTIRVTEAFKATSTAALQTAAAQDRLAIAYARYGAGTLGAAQATVRYRKELDALKASQMAGMQAVARGLTMYVSLPLAAVGYEATKMALNFNRDMLLIQTQAGASASEVQKMTAAVLKLAPAVGMGPDELAKGLYHLESIGLRGAKALDTLKISALAARMGMASLEDVSTALGGVVVTGIKGAQDYKTALGTLVAGVGAGNMRFEDLAQAIGGVAPAAAAAGMSLPELMAALATLTDRGFSVEEAVTRMRMTIGMIQSPSKAATKALADIGVSAKSLGGILREPGGTLKVLELLNTAMQKAGAARGNRDLLEGFGRARSGLGIQTLVQSLSSNVSDYKSKVDQVIGQQQRFGSNLDTYMASPSFRLHKALATLETDLTKLGTDLLPGVTIAAESVAKVFHTLASIINALPGPAKSALGILAGELAAAGPIALGVIGVTKLIGSLRTAIAMLPVTAGPAAAEAGTEIATGIGAGTTAAEAEIASLRGSLLGLGSLAIPVLTIPISLELIGKEKDWLTKHAGMLGAPGKALLDLASGGAAGNVITDVTGISGSKHGVLSHIFKSGPKGKVTQAEVAAVQKMAAAGASPTAIGEMLYKRFGVRSRATAEAILQQASYTHSYSPDNRGYVAGVGKAGVDTGVSGPAGNGAVVHDFQPSEAARLNLALAKNPNSKAAIEAKLAYDEKAAAFAEKRIAEGRGNPKLVQQLQNVYNDEASLRARLAAMNKKSSKAASQFTIPIGLQTRLAEAEITPGTSDDDKANAAIAAYIRRQLPHLHGAKRLAALQALKGYLPAPSSGTLTVPLDLQLQEAKANASGVQSAQVAAAMAIKKWAEGIIHSKHATEQQLIDAYNLIAQENSTIGVHAASYAVKVSSMQFVAGIKGLTGAAKQEVEARYAQATAHGGYVPTGTGVLGQTIVINVNGDPNPETTARKVVHHVQKHSKHGTAQRRGPNAGKYLGLH